MQDKQNTNLVYENAIKLGIDSILAQIENFPKQLEGEILKSLFDKAPFLFRYKDLQTPENSKLLPQIYLIDGLYDELEKFKAECQQHKEILRQQFAGIMQLEDKHLSKIHFDDVVKNYHVTWIYRLQDKINHIPYDFEQKIRSSYPEYFIISEQDDNNIEGN